MSTEDQLTSISLEDLPSLIDLYERGNDQDSQIDSINTLKNYKRWLESSTAKCIELDILILNNGWTSDGLFFCRVGESLFISTLANDEARLTAAVKSVANYYIVLIRPGQERIVSQALREKGIGTDYEFHEYNHYYCSVEKALQVEYTIPDHVILRPITAENVTEINDLLPYKGKHSGNYIRQMIQMLPSIGAFNRETGELMGWILTFMNECHSALVVKPQFRRNGLAKLLAQKLMHDRALQNKPSYCYFPLGNVAARQLFSSLRFVSVGTVSHYDKVGL